VGDSAVAPADSCFIAAQIIADAIATPGSALAGMSINIAEATPNVNPIVASYPITQLQTIDTLLTDLAEGGYGTGFDFGFDVSWSAGQGSTPVVTLNISYPRRGRIAGSTGLVLAEPIIGYSWPEDATTQGNTQYGSASSSGLVSQAGPDETVISAGWPLLEQVQSYTNVTTQSALDAATTGSLAQFEWPITTPKITTKAFGGSLELGDFLMGDDLRVILDPDEWFIDGLDTYMRVTEVDVTAADAGASTMALTFGQPPGLAPIAPPPM
jgi:hypothetical protein